MKQKMITVRMSDDEFNKVVAGADANGLSLNEYSKRKMLDQSVTENKPKGGKRGRKAKLTLIRMTKAESDQLLMADSKCEHVHSPNEFDGIKCFKCGGWYCA